ncbi:hypothetical protein ACF065_28075 [Streptomyces sp. NPDC015232]|uniref:hypothetical protein n=1 Tax=unclassified Streptomyces TaxID=2593676 RepID=UPI00370149F5
MEAELVALATAGATALVQQMVGDGWERARTRVAAFFAARSGGDEQAVGAELDAAREELVRATEGGDQDAADEARTEARVEWRARMRRSLLADPEAAAELRRILAELEGVGPAVPQQVTTVHNTLTGGSHGLVLQVGTVHRMHTVHDTGTARDSGEGRDSAGPDGPRP